MTETKTLYEVKASDIDLDALVTNHADPSRLETSRGIVFKLRKVPALIANDAVKRIVDPKPPIWHDPDKDRDEINPNDPVYLEAKARAQGEREDLMTRIYMTMGAEVVTLPKGIESPESEVWAEELTEFGLVVPESGRARYYAWLKWYALTDDDLKAFIAAILRYGGATLEGDVVKAAATFRANGAGTTDSGSDST